MKWHDARIEPPKDDVEVMLKGLLEYGSYHYCAWKKPQWKNVEHMDRDVSFYPFYATLAEVEKELDSDD